MEEEIREKFEKIKEIVRTRKLWISRIPIKTRDYFLNLAKEEFENDYGMCLCFLVKVHQGYFPTGHEEIHARLDILEKKMVKLEKKPTSSSKSIRTVGGRKLKLKEKEE